MTAGELGIIFFGLAAGYWVVSALVLPPKSAKRPAADSGGDGAQGQAGPGPQANEADGRDPAAPATWWEVLEVARDADVDQIKAAYQKRIGEYHPDRVARLGRKLQELAELESQRINAAYDAAMAERNAR